MNTKAFGLIFLEWLMRHPFLTVTGLCVLVLVMTMATEREVPMCCGRITRKVWTGDYDVFQCDKCKSIY